MATPEQTTESTASYFAGDDRPSKIKRLAAFLIMLGSELAADILKQFEDADIAEISTEMAKIEAVDFATQSKLLEEFSQIAVGSSVAITGGAKYTQQVLEKSIGAYRAHELVQRIAPKGQSIPTAETLKDFDAQHLFNLLKNEDSQTIAFVLSYVDTVKCADALGLMRPEVREEVVERIATMEPTSADVVNEVIETLKQQGGFRRTRSTISGGLQSIADVINKMDSTLSKALLGALDERNPELSNSIKKILFVFEDLKRLDSLSLQKVLREVESKDLSVALKTASEALQQIIMAALPKRAAENLRDEIKFMGPVRLIEIEAAQDQIISVMRRLEGAGEIIINGSGKGDIVV